MFLDTCIYMKSIKMHESDKYQVQDVISGVGGGNRIGKGVDSISVSNAFFLERKI